MQRKDCLLIKDYSKPPIQDKGEKKFEQRIAELCKSCISKPVMFEKECMKGGCSKKVQVILKDEFYDHFLCWDKYLCRGCFYELKNTMGRCEAKECNKQLCDLLMFFKGRYPRRLCDDHDSDIFDDDHTSMYE